MPILASEYQCFQLKKRIKSQLEIVTKEVEVKNRMNMSVEKNGVKQKILVSYVTRIKMLLEIRLQNLTKSGKFKMPN
jgi:hypothetical protein